LQTAGLDATKLIGTLLWDALPQLRQSPLGAELVRAMETRVVTSTEHLIGDRWYCCALLRSLTEVSRSSRTTSRRASARRKAAGERAAVRPCVSPRALRDGALRARHRQDHRRQPGLGALFEIPRERAMGITVWELGIYVDGADRTRLLGL